MKTARLCIGIVSMVLFLVIMFQSCAAGIGEALSGDEGGSAGSGFFVAFLMLIAGIVGVCTRKSVVGAYITAIFYVIAGIIGVSSIGSFFADLVIWGVVSFIFGALFVIGGILTKKAIKQEANITTEE
jgi:hypothetical protein